jgi:hypothetical protein
MFACGVSSFCQGNLRLAGVVSGIVGTSVRALLLGVSISVMTWSSSSSNAAFPPTSNSLSSLSSSKFGRLRLLLEAEGPTSGVCGGGGDGFCGRSREGVAG